MTGNELLKILQAMTPAELAGDIEGCDCYGEMTAVSSEVGDTPEDTEILFRRDPPGARSGYKRVAAVGELYRK